MKVMQFVAKCIAEKIIAERTIIEIITHSNMRFAVFGALVELSF